MDKTYRGKKYEKVGDRVRIESDTIRLNSCKYFITDFFIVRYLKSCADLDLCRSEEENSFRRVAVKTKTCDRIAPY